MIGLIFGETGFPTEILKKIKKKNIKYLIIDLTKGKFKKDKKSQSIDFDESIEGHYLKISILSEVNGGTWASASEIGVIGISSQ